MTHVRAVAQDTIGTSKASLREGVFPAIATDIQIDAKTARECALTVSTTQLGSTVSVAKRVTMEAPSMDPVGFAPVLTPTALLLDVLWMEEL